MAADAASAKGGTGSGFRAGAVEGATRRRIEALKWAAKAGTCKPAFEDVYSVTSGSLSSYRVPRILERINLLLPMHGTYALLGAPLEWPRLAEHYITSCALHSYRLQSLCETNLLEGGANAIPGLRERSGDATETGAVAGGLFGFGDDAFKYEDTDAAKDESDSSEAVSSSGKI